MPIKFGKTTKQVDRQTKKVSIVHEYIKCKSIQELIDAYNKENMADQRFKYPLVKVDAEGSGQDIEYKLILPRAKGFPPSFKWSELL